MKKIFWWTLVLIALCWYSFAYEPTATDITNINTLALQLNEISSGNMQDKWDFYIQLKTLQEKYPNDEKLSYYLTTLSSYMSTQISTEKNKAKATSKAFKQEFLRTYTGGISKEITASDTCTWWYTTLDNLSFANNFPTALTIATRYRESSCGYYLPANGDGPFQILSKDYGTGTMTEATFLRSVQDFIDFSKAKHTQYKTKLWITLTYTGFDWTGLVNHAALYNGATITWNADSGYIALPNIPSYVYDGYGSAYSGASRYGILPKFLKVLDWEIHTTY